MAIGPVERHAARNAVVVSVGFVIVRGLKKMLRRGARSSSRPAAKDDWEEVWKTALAAAATSFTYGRGKKIMPENVAGALSFLPVKLLCDENSYSFNYNFIVAYLFSQILVGLIPKGYRNPILLNSLSSAQLLSSWILSDDHLPEHYIRFLYSQGKANKDHIHTLRDKFNTSTNKEVIKYAFPQKKGQTLTEKHGTDVGGIFKAAGEYFVKHYKEAIQFYCKIYTLRLLVHFLRKGGATGLASVLSVEPVPKLSLQTFTFLSDVLRSSFFLTAYCTSAWWAIAMTGHVLPDSRCSPYVLWCSLLLPGLFLAVESPQQQVTISNYCATFAAYPLLCYKNGFDVAAIASTLLCTTGTAQKPFLLKMMWYQ
eukprot:TRINITY_DN1405_c0_g2_i1.p1 TRINITY_DN1405_c0_g2~~TRINITY_DN1405_c0_g2_i1.p1  ORF type:complete len:368 (+),score=53.60 TRINITY_DN1405_c0_g2_i1:51-1154(+)